MFTWIPIYEEIAEKVLAFEQRQAELIALIRQMNEGGLLTISLTDRDAEGREFELQEIDPFTFFANFNRRLKPENRSAILAAIKDHWRLNSSVPTDFDGLPVVLPDAAWFVKYPRERRSQDVSLLWRLAREVREQGPETFNPQVFDDCLAIKGLGISKLTIGMFWLRPQSYLSADDKNLGYLAPQGIRLEEKSGAGYLRFLREVDARVGDNLPELSHQAELYAQRHSSEKTQPGTGSQKGKAGENIAKPSSDNADGRVAPYQTSDAAAAKELFLSESAIADLLRRLRRKKNLILQGPPGVGKTFVARRLAYLLMGAADAGRVATVQFHQSYSYEDFVQGLRPNSEGKFILKNGLFYDFSRRAARDPQRDYVFVIDEINRGNLSKIFGELMMLIEPDKRGEQFAIPLAYSATDADTFSVPENLYLIGTMNTADRSLSLVDYALRRRFAFAALAPQFESPQFAAMLSEAGAAPPLIGKIRQRFSELNALIGRDTRDLGPGYCIGHSFFCLPNGERRADEDWYREVIESEIRPLLEEYWADDSAKVDERVTGLLA